MSKLYVVGTPIGNLSDISIRAVETLKTVDFIAAEDTRVSLKLLNHFDISKPMISYHEHNLRERGEIITSKIQNGESCAIITDAGMPCISDPGEDLVRLCHEKGIEITVIPGPTAMASALAVSGLKTGRFAFEGFLSVKKSHRKDHLESVSKDTRTLIFYEGPHKLLNTLKDMRKYLGNRKITIAKELTKIYETIIPTTFDEAIDYFEDKLIKGEYVIVVEGAKEEPPEEISLEEGIEMVKKLCEKGESLSQAAKDVSKQTGLKKSELYKGAVN